MYVTAHRVVTRRREQGINAYIYHHGPRRWARPPRPEDDPGELVNTLLTVNEVGGNDVRSYLGVVAPDDVFWPQIEPRFLQFVESARLTPFPWEAEVGSCLFQLGMDRPLARSWRRELGLLYKACVLVRPHVASLDDRSR